MEVGASFEGVVLAVVVAVVCVSGAVEEDDDADEVRFTTGDASLDDETVVEDGEMLGMEGNDEGVTDAEGGEMFETDDEVEEEEEEEEEKEEAIVTEGGEIGAEEAAVGSPFND